MSTRLAKDSEAQAATTHQKTASVTTSTVKEAERTKTLELRSLGASRVSCNLAALRFDDSKSMAICDLGGYAPIHARVSLANQTAKVRATIDLHLL
jgi:hypothetical protein